MILPDGTSKSSVFDIAFRTNPDLSVIGSHDTRIVTEVPNVIEGYFTLASDATMETDRGKNYQPGASTAIYADWITQGVCPGLPSNSNTRLRIYDVPAPAGLIGGATMTAGQVKLGQDRIFEIAFQFYDSAGNFRNISVNPYYFLNAAKDRNGNYPNYQATICEYLAEIYTSGTFREKTLENLLVDTASPTPTPTPTPTPQPPPVESPPMVPQDQYDELLANYEDCITNLNRITQEYSILEQDYNDFLRDYTTLQNTNSALEGEVDRLTGLLRTCQDELADLQKRFDDLLVQLESATGDDVAVTALRTELEKCKADYAKCQAELSTCQTNRDALQKAYDDCIAGSGGTVGTSPDMDSELVKCLGDLEDCRRKLEEMTNLHTACQKKLAPCLEENGRLQTRIAELEGDAVALDPDLVDDLTRQLRECKDRLAEMEGTEGWELECEIWKRRFYYLRKRYEYLLMRYKGRIGRQSSTSDLYPWIALGAVSAVAFRQMTGK